MLRWARGLVCMPCDAGTARRARHRADGARRTAPAATPRSRCRSTTSTAGSGIGAADRAHTIRRVLDPAAAAVRLPAARPRVPAARPRRRRARAARPHRGRGRPRPPRRPAAGRGDLRGAPRRRLAGALPVPRAVRRRSTASRWSRSTRSSSTASPSTTPRRTVSSPRSSSDPLRRRSTRRDGPVPSGRRAPADPLPLPLPPSSRARRPRWASSSPRCSRPGASRRRRPLPARSRRCRSASRIRSAPARSPSSTRRGPRSRSARTPARPSRRIPTTIWYPSDGGGPFPLVVFVPGFGATPARTTRHSSTGSPRRVRRGRARRSRCSADNRRARPTPSAGTTSSPTRWFVTTQVLSVASGTGSAG